MSNKVIHFGIPRTVPERMTNFVKEVSYKIILLLMAFIILSGCSERRQATVKVMTWNIWHGGLHGDRSSQFKKDTANTINTVRVIEEADPDILFMQETYCCGMQIARKAGYAYSCRGSSNLSIHSKYPIVDSMKIYHPFNAHAVIIDVQGQKLLCINIWLNYLPDFFVDIKTKSPDELINGEKETRLKEIKAILHRVDSLEERWHLPVILGGDFNSGSHLDWIKETKDAHYEKVVEWPVSKFLAVHGYTDSFREAHPNPVATLQGTWGFLEKQFISDRIDFIYYKGDALKVRSSRIIMDDPEGGFFNSDHRAIVSVFDLDTE